MLGAHGPFHYRTGANRHEPASVVARASGYCFCGKLLFESIEELEKIKMKRQKLFKTAGSLFGFFLLLILMAAPKMAQAQIPSITYFQASSNIVMPGQSVTLYWSTITPEGTGCEGSWGGGVLPANGQHTINGLRMLTTFTLSCGGPGGELVSQSVLVNAGYPSPTPVQPRPALKSQHR